MLRIRPLQLWLASHYKLSVDSIHMRFYCLKRYSFLLLVGKKKKMSFKPSSSICYVNLRHFQPWLGSTMPGIYSHWNFREQKLHVNFLELRLVRWAVEVFLLLKYWVEQVLTPMFYLNKQRISTQANYTRKPWNPRNVANLTKSIP